MLICVWRATVWYCSTEKDRVCADRPTWRSTWLWVVIVGLDCSAFLTLTDCESCSFSSSVNCLVILCAFLGSFIGGPV